LNLLSALKAELIDPIELQKIKNKAESNLIFSESSVVGKAMSLGYYEYLGNIDLINDYKVLIPKAWGIGSMSKDLLSPLIVEPNSCCTETYLILCPIAKKSTAENLISYTQTKFFHLLVSLIKLTQNAMKKVYSFVPIQDFTEKSDIDWSKSISEIDQQLYKKYKLSQEEIAFIEENVQPMA
jgi:site-specific DNA-methyltransferase (adenine-specific)